MKKIETLVDDIYNLFNSGHSPSEESLTIFAENIKQHLVNALAKREHKKTLRGSSIGEMCDRKTWYDVHSPELGEELPGYTCLKFLLGNLVEEIVLVMAKESGHTVTHRQEEVEVDGVLGHIDAVIDGVLVDVKSTTGYGMNKFRNNGLINDDSFGYLPQILFYHERMKDVPDVQEDRVAFLGVSRDQGHMGLDVYRVEDVRKEVTRTTGRGIKDQVAHKITVAEDTNLPPRGYGAEPDGRSGNLKLGVKCSYCSMKAECWPSVRTFLYSNGPRYLTKVEKLPDVPEVQKNKKKHIQE